MFCSEVRTVKARKEGRCTSCAEPIHKGDDYKYWTSCDGSWGVSKMHPECLAMHEEDSGGGQWEYAPFGYERPKAVTGKEGDNEKHDPFYDLDWAGAPHDFGEDD